MTPDVLAETIKTQLAAHDWNPHTVRTERTWKPVKKLEAFTGRDPLLSVMPFGVESKRLDRAGWSRFIQIHVAFRGRCVTDAETDTMCQLGDAVDEFLENLTADGVILVDTKADPLWDAGQLSSNNLWFGVFVLNFMRR